MKSSTAGRFIGLSGSQFRPAEGSPEAKTKGQEAVKTGKEIPCPTPSLFFMFILTLSPKLTLIV